MIEELTCSVYDSSNFKRWTLQNAPYFGFPSSSVPS